MLNISIASGESMENALRACCKGIKIGKILIHREGDNGQQVCAYLWVCVCMCFISLVLTFFLLLKNASFTGQLIYEKLPSDISERHVLLLDPILGTGLYFSCGNHYPFLNCCWFLCKGLCIVSLLIWGLICFHSCLVVYTLYNLSML